METRSNAILGGPLYERNLALLGIETAEEKGWKKLPPGFDMGPRMR